LLKRIFAYLGQMAGLKNQDNQALKANYRLNRNKVPIREAIQQEVSHQIAFILPGSPVIGLKSIVNTRPTIATAAQTKKANR